MAAGHGVLPFPETHSTTLDRLLVDEVGPCGQSCGRWGRILADS